jgi:hypothetical protein
MLVSINFCPENLNVTLKNYVVVEELQQTVI